MQNNSIRFRHSCFWFLRCLHEAPCRTQLRNLLAVYFESHARRKHHMRTDGTGEALWHESQEMKHLGWSLTCRWTQTRRLNVLSASLRRTRQLACGAVTVTTSTPPGLRTNISHTTAPTRRRSYEKSRSDGCCSATTKTMIAANRRRNRKAMQTQNEQPDAEARVGIFVRCATSCCSTACRRAEPYGDHLAYAPCVGAVPAADSSVRVRFFCGETLNLCKRSPYKTL